MINKNTDYLDCLLAFEEALIKERDKHIEFSNEAQRCLYMHFKRVIRIQNAIHYFNKIYYEKELANVLYRQLVYLLKRISIF